MLNAGKKPGWNELRLGQIGCGSFGESHLATLTGIPFVKVVAVTDVVEQRAKELALRYGVPRVVKDSQELCALRDIDAVSVVTTEDQHLEPVLAALQNRKHVFVEKPMATRVTDAQKMADAARKAGCILMPGHILRFETRYATVKEQIASGRLGRVVSIYARRNRPKREGTVYNRTHLAFETAIHDIDTMLWYTESKVKRVRGYNRRVSVKSGDDLFCGVLEFENGAIGVLQTAWLLPDRTEALDDCMEVIASAGVANIDILHSGLTVWREDGHSVPDVSYEPRLRGSVFGALREELSHFAQCALEGRQPTVVTAQDGVEAVRVAAAVSESASSEREILLPTAASAPAD